MYRFFLLFCFISGINSYYNAKGLSHNISQDFVRDTIYTTFEKYDRTVVRYENTIVNHIKQNSKKSLYIYLSFIIRTIKAMVLIINFYIIWLMYVFTFGR